MNAETVRKLIAEVLGIVSTLHKLLYTIQISQLLEPLIRKGFIFTIVVYK